MIATGDPAPARPGPALGADTDEVLQACGVEAEEREALRSQRVI